MIIEFFSNKWYVTIVYEKQFKLIDVRTCVLVDGTEINVMFGFLFAADIVLNFEINLDSMFT